MAENRKFSRLPCAEKKGVILQESRREEVSIIDLSTGGMRISLYKPLGIGSDLYGEFKVLPNTGPFFIKGKVTRICENNGSWEAAVRFDKVSTIPF